MLVVPCSTVRRVAPTHVPLGRGEAGLPAASVAKCEQVMTVPRAELAPEAVGTVLGRERMDQVERALLRAFGIGPAALERHLRTMLGPGSPGGDDPISGGSGGQHPGS